jgi:hypothetical protein
MFIFEFCTWHVWSSTRLCYFEGLSRVNNRLVALEGKERMFVPRHYKLFTIWLIVGRFSGSICQHSRITDEISSGQEGGIVGTRP